MSIATVRETSPSVSSTHPRQSRRTRAGVAAGAVASASAVYLTASATGVVPLFRPVVRRG